MVDYHDHKSPLTNPFLMSLLFLEILVFIFFATAADYADAASEGEIGTAGSEVTNYYGMYQDVHVMIFIGFGFLMTFLRKHGFNSLGLTFLLSCMAIQMHLCISTLFHSWFTGHAVKLTLTIPHLIRGDFAAGAVLISLGAVLGRATWTQLIWMCFFELIFYTINEYLGVEEFKAVDMGGSMFVHTFGAYFGLAFSFMLGPPSKEEKEHEASVYHSDMFAMIGTIFLWMFWPSFNGALAGSNFHQQERVVINTVLALSCSCISTFFFSHFFEGKLDMVHIQNASLAGGVAIGSSSDLVVGPWASILIGLFAGFLSTWGYVVMDKFLKRVNVYDVCGVHNLHGMPGVVGGLAGAISASMADEKEYGQNIGAIFPARAADADNRSAGDQGGYQALTLFVTLCFAIGGGIITGVFVTKVNFCKTRKKHFFSDEDEWEVPEEEFLYSYFGPRSRLRKGSEEMDEFGEKKAKIINSPLSV